MLNVTMAARARLARKLAHKTAAPNITLRFTRRTGGWSLRLDQPTPVDETFAYEGRIVLALDHAVSEAMSRRTLDVKKTQAGARLVLRWNKSRPSTERGRDDLIL